MRDLRKLVIILIIAILFAVLVFSTIEAIYPKPEYSDFCQDSQPRTFVKEDLLNCSALQIDSEFSNQCNMKKGYIDYEYDSKGCAVNYYCNDCSVEYNEAESKYRQLVFYISAVLSLIAVFIGLYLPAKKNKLNEWIGTGFMLGGAFALFFGTISSYQALGKLIRPFIILFEIILVIFVAYKKSDNFKD